ncbi:MAG: hypothetical protein EOO01_39275, partial [Chitinophagaceae bacterium]
MKKIVALLLILTSANMLQAQVVRKEEMPAQKKFKPLPVPVNPPATNPAPAPAPSKTTVPAPAPSKASQPEQQPAVTPVYSLTSARVSIRTGQDNKEFPSTASFYLVPKQYGGQPRKDVFVQAGITTELKSNTTTEFGLEKMKNAPQNDFSLTSIQTNGLLLGIHYFANTIFDAWKIESVTVILEFRDQDGNLHPNLGMKSIVFSNATGFLNYFDKDMV